MLAMKIGWWTVFNWSTNKFCIWMAINEAKDANNQYNKKSGRQTKGKFEGEIEWNCNYNVYDLLIKFEYHFV